MIVFWFLGINVVTFLAFGLDKRLAEANAWRISESTLLSLALLGGSPGAIAGQQIFRHKTQKEPFRTRLYSIIGLQVVALGLMGVRPDLLANALR